MNHSDKAKFKELFDGLADYYYPDKAGDDNPRRLGKAPLKIYFGALQLFTVEELSRAASHHLADTGSGRFFPKAADLILHLEGGKITADQVVAAAKLAETPFGIMARMHIGTGNLNDLNSYELKQIAEEVLQLLPKWKEQAAAGDYRPGQISIMIKHGVNPLAPFHQGMAGPINQTALSARITSITSTKRHQELLKRPNQEQSANPVPLAQTLAKLESDSESS